jgi:hypothetical protein
MKLFEIANVIILFLLITSNATRMRKPRKRLRTTLIVDDLVSSKNASSDHSVAIRNEDESTKPNNSTVQQLIKSVEDESNSAYNIGDKNSVKIQKEIESIIEILKSVKSTKDTLSPHAKEALRHIINVPEKGSHEETGRKQKVLENKHKIALAPKKTIDLECKFGNFTD